MRIALGVIYWLCGFIAMVDAVRHPDSDWVVADRKKSFWVVWIFLGGFIGAAIYLLSIRPRFQSINGGGTSERFLK